MQERRKRVSEDEVRIGRRFDVDLVFAVVVA